MCANSALAGHRFVFCPLCANLGFFVNKKKRNDLDGFLSRPEIRSNISRIWFSAVSFPFCAQWNSCLSVSVCKLCLPCPCEWRDLCIPFLTRCCHQSHACKFFAYFVFSIYRHSCICILLYIYTSSQHFAVDITGNGSFSSSIFQ